MLSMLRKRLASDDEGFTLIELMVVVLIIAILIAIAIPTFLGAQDRARDRSAQSDLRNALTAAKTIAVDSAGTFQVNSVDIVPADMASAEPSLNFAGAASAGVGTVGVTTGAGGVDILLVEKSASGKFFGIKATSGGAVTYCSGTTAPTVCTSAKW